MDARLDRIVDDDRRLPAAIGRGLGIRHRGGVAQPRVHPWRILGVAVLAQHLVERSHRRHIDDVIAWLRWAGRVRDWAEHWGDRDSWLIGLVRGRDFTTRYVVRRLLNLVCARKPVAQVDRWLSVTLARGSLDQPRAAAL